ncbi:hypothetical protein ACHMW6_18125 [Pseudoduganella sp. UC29_106]
MADWLVRFSLPMAQHQFIDDYNRKGLAFDEGFSLPIRTRCACAAPAY